jgi:hypothetical protein
MEPQQLGGIYDLFYRLEQIIKFYFYKRVFRAHAQTRSSVERLYGVWKQRFQCLSRGSLRFREPIVSASVIEACACLQNFLVDERYEHYT